MLLHLTYVLNMQSVKNDIKNVLRIHNNQNFLPVFRQKETDN